MRFDEYYLNERKGSKFRNCIVVDVQPLYEESIKKYFSLDEFGNFLLNINKNILYFYNGPDTIGSDDSEDVIIDWLIEHNPKMEKMDWSNVFFTQKSYSFYRDFMDAGVSDNGMKQILRYMANNRINDSRDIDLDEWKNILSNSDLDRVKDGIEDEKLVIWTPDISIAELKSNWNGSLLCGGSGSECLKEIQLILNAFNIKYHLVDEFIYYG